MLNYLAFYWRSKAFVWNVKISALITPNCDFQSFNWIARIFKKRTLWSKIEYLSKKLDRYLGKIKLRFLSPSKLLQFSSKSHLVEHEYCFWYFRVTELLSASIEGLCWKWKLKKQQDKNTNLVTWMPFTINIFSS